MKIEKLNLISFGKFKNKEINLSPNINIIYGLNESGKTTIHNFIEGIFYGFLRPYVTRALYKDEHAKYNPWYSSEYKGSLTLEKDKNKYIIERNFKKGEEYTRVLIKETGENIIDSIDTGNGGRIDQPGNYFFGFNDVVYDNTVSIKQLGVKTEQDLAKELKDKLANLTTSLDDDISVKKAVDYLDEKLKEIGSERAYTTPYGKSIVDLKKLEEEYRNLSFKKEEYLEFIKKEDEINKLIEKEDKNLSISENLKNNIIYRNKKILLEEIKNGYEEVETLENEIKKLEEFKDFSINDYSLVLEISSENKQLEERINEHKLEYKSLLKKIKELEYISIQKALDNEDIENDFYKYEELEEKLENLRKETYKSDERFLKLDLKDNETKLKNYKIIISFLIGITFFSISMYFFAKEKIQLSFNIVTLPIIFILGSKYRKSQKAIIRTKDYITEFKRNNEQIELEIATCNKEKDDILQKYNTDSYIEFKKIYDEFIYKNIQKDEYNKNKEYYLEREIKLKNKIIDLESKRDINKLNINKIYEKNSSSSLEELKDSIGKKKKYDDISREIKSKLTILDRMLEGKSYKDLELELVDIKEKININIGNVTLDLKTIHEKINVEKEKLNNLKIEKITVKEKINLLEESIQRLRTVEEEIERKKEKILKYEEKLKSINLAKNTIISISKNIHRDYAPEINSTVGSMMEKITNGKYSEILIDDNLEIKVKDPLSKESINIDSLSGGTIDQLYFSLRYGIIKQAEELETPLILDDCFIQYDDNRIKEILKFLDKESKSRQIILFTCQKREVEILDGLGVKYNLVSL